MQRVGMGLSVERFVADPRLRDYLSAQNIHRDTGCTQAGQTTSTQYAAMNRDSFVISKPESILLFLLDFAVAKCNAIARQKLLH
jgi:hypothetical protein